MDEHLHATRQPATPRSADDSRSAVGEFAVANAQIEDGTVVLAITGEIDLATAPEFERCLIDTLGNGAAHVIVDLTGCDFLDSTGLNVLTRARYYLDGSPTLSLIVPPGTIPRRTLEIANFDRLFPTYPGLAAAIDARPDRGNSNIEGGSDGSEGATAG